MAEVKEMNVIDVFNKVKESFENIDKSKPQDFPEAASVGDTFRQGDLYVEYLGKELPQDIKKMQKCELQLAPGTTKGSRHILDREVDMYVRNNATPLDGPVFNVGEKGCTIQHPEHGDVNLPSGCYGITYQRQFAEELRRVAD